ncbi:hypothetical protein Hanom_Chr17g01566041 [Helianthus anomalus]
MFITFICTHYHSCNKRILFPQKHPLRHNFNRLLERPWWQWKNHFPLHLRVVATTRKLGICDCR